MKPLLSHYEAIIKLFYHTLHASTMPIWRLSLQCLHNVVSNLALCCLRHTVLSPQILWPWVINPTPSEHRPDWLYLSPFSAQTVVLDTVSIHLPQILWPPMMNLTLYLSLPNWLLLSSISAPTVVLDTVSHPFTTDLVAMGDVVNLPQLA